MTPEGGDGGFTVAATTAPGLLPVGAALDGLGSVVAEVLFAGRVTRRVDPGHPDAGQDGSRLLGAGLRSLLIAPVAARGTAAGVLVLASRSPTAFGGDREGFVMAVGTQLGLGLVSSFDGGSRAGPDDRVVPPDACPRGQGCSRNGGIIVASAALRSVLARIDLVAPTNAGVLVLGESGTGKELVAQEIHRRSRRAGGPLVAVNCASVPRELFESEFFGHVKGAFTGALRGRAGRFQDADGGTLFLDEVAEIPLDMQAKLLRVLQEGRYERVGEGISRRADVRVVAATNRNLTLEVEAGRFRSDLYYRLDVFPIELPPLRDRPEAIAPLARHFLERFAVELNVPRPDLDEATIRRLEAYHWPGNVRELQNVIERAVILSRGHQLGVDLRVAPPPRSGCHPEAPAELPRVLTAAEVRLIERDNLEAALRACRGKVYGQGGAAELLGMAPSTLTDRLRRLGLTARRWRGGGAGDGGSS